MEIKVNWFGYCPKTIGLIVAVVFLSAASSAATSDQKVTVRGYIPPGESYVNNSNTYDGNVVFSPYETRTLSSQGKSFTFEAFPLAGWKVDCWYRADGTSLYSSFPGTAKRVGEGLLAYTHAYDYTSSANNSYVTLAVAFAHLKYRIDWLDRGQQVYSQDDVIYTNRVGLSSCSPSRDGYALTGWSQEGRGLTFATDAVCTGESFGITNHDDNAVVRLSAIWQARQYTVSFDSNGHGSQPAAKTVTYGQTYGELSSLACDGWDFDGWFTGREGGTKVTAETPVAILADQTLYAHWTQRFRVIFREASLFQDVTLLDTTVRKGNGVSPPASPSHPGYTFNGWTGWDGFSNVEQDRTYTATYTANEYVLTYHSNGSGETSYGQDFTWHDSKALMANQFKRVGYAFVGWALTATGEKFYGGSENVSGEWVASHPDLYALWEPIRFTVRFDANGGEGGMADQMFIYDVEQTLTPNAFAKEGVDFKGWKGSDGKSYADKAAVKNLMTDPQTPFVMTAVWSENYTLQFDANGATVTNTVMSPMTFADAEERKVLPPTGYALPGYTFLGWATNRDDAAAWKWTYADGAEVGGLGKPAEIVTFYATWTNNTYTVKFDGGEGATGSMSDLTLVYDKPQELPKLGFVREPSDIWAFVGWSNTVSGATYLTNGVDRVTVSNLTTEANGVVKLNAIWKSSLSELSQAMKCYNLQWESENELWVPVREGGYDGTSCAFTESVERWVFMSANLTTTTTPTNGVLRFFCKAEPGGKLTVVGDNTLITEITVGSWQEAVVEVNNHQRIDILKNGDGKFFVDRMTWIPEGTVVDPTEEDAVMISSVEMADGAFKLTFTSDVKFDYNLLTNANLLIDSWGVMMNKAGDGKAVTFEPRVLPGMPQLFYKVETIRKQP